MLTETMGLEDRVESACKVCATISLPVPCSPVIKHIGVGGANPRYGVEYRLHGGRRGNELGPAFGLEQAILRRQSFGLLQCTVKFDLCPQDREQALVLPGLRNEIPRTTAHRFHGECNVRPRRHHDNRSRTVEGNDLGEEVETLAAGSCVSRVIQVDEKSIVRAGSESLAHACRRFCHFQFVALRAQEEFDGFENMLLVVGGQDAWLVMCRFPCLTSDNCLSGFAEICMD